ncbi:MAG: DUF4492 domain-containing protein [Bacteroidales bacterium]|nr:DUF4492 domain-containing protein [Bacteroidales bacterium]
MLTIFKKIWKFYADGIRSHKLGPPLLFLIFLKFFIMFAILKTFFFKPAMAGMTDEQKSETVGNNILRNHNDSTFNLKTD